MEGNIPQVTTTKEVQPEAKGISQAPQQPPVVPQAPLESIPPPKPKKGLKTKKNCSVSYTRTCSGSNRLWCFSLHIVLQLRQDYS